MSFQAMTWATAQTCGSAAKLVLVMFANHSNGHTGQCNPKHKLLAARMRNDSRYIKESFKSLSLWVNYYCPKVCRRSAIAESIHITFATY